MAESPGPHIDAARVIADLRELDARTGGRGGARRIAWTQTWREARGFFGELLADIGLEPERDEAGNVWARLDGAGGTALVLGSHLDSVPQGGWLDGALGVMAGLGVLRAWVDAGEAPPRPLALVDWADEEGARFGRSLLGSSAFSGTLEPEAVRDLTDHDGVRLEDALAENGVELARALEAGSRRAGLGAYLELHIEQGPVLEADELRAAAVAGCVGIERRRLRFIGQASHAGTTPMNTRRDAGLAAAEAALAIELIASDHDGRATTGALELRPGIVSAVAGEADLFVDLRHARTDQLKAMLDATLEAGEAAAADRRCEWQSEAIWRIEPIEFDPELVAAARAACEEVAGSDRVLVSGALHDAAEVARVVPTAMMFTPSIAGLSHTPAEDTTDEDLAVAIEAYGLLANRVLAGDAS